MVRGIGVVVTGLKNCVVKLVMDWTKVLELGTGLRNLNYELV